MSHNSKEIEKFRAECEARFVASKDAKWIKDYLAKVQEKRGFDAYQKLRDDVMKLWRK